MANALVVVATLIAASVLLLPRVRRSEIWRATTTPLASIIGSGFLVLAPLLVREFGTRAVGVMAGLCALAWAVGEAVRWNIRQLDAENPRGLVVPLESASTWALSFAYVISVCYYLNLFGAFATSLVPEHTALHARLLTTAALLVVAAMGWSGGLHTLENAEQITVGAKLAIIAGLLAGLVLYTAHAIGAGALQHDGGPIDASSVPFVLGLVITVQGFETSRYLGAEYDASTRIRSMRHAQLLSTAIYVVYIGLVGMTFPRREIALDETAVIEMMTPVAGVLPGLLVLAALAAQFSAAVADTNGCGGLVQEMTGGRIRSRWAYLLLVVLALALTWTADVFEIISYASRSFAVYYALQSAVAAALAWQRSDSWMRRIGFLLLAAVMLVAAVIGAPAE